MHTEYGLFRLIRGTQIDNTMNSIGVSDMTAILNLFTHSAKIPHRYPHERRFSFDILLNASDETVQKMITGYS
jgi:hypothetical protein